MKCASMFVLYLALSAILATLAKFHVKIVTMVLLSVKSCSPHILSLLWRRFLSRYLLIRLIRLRLLRLLCNDQPLSFRRKLITS